MKGGELGYRYNFGSLCFFFQAEDGIRDWSVTGVQTCALPISRSRAPRNWAGPMPIAPSKIARSGWSPAGLTISQRLETKTSASASADAVRTATLKIGRASCRERV